MPLNNQFQHPFPVNFCRFTDSVVRTSEFSYDLGIGSSLEDNQPPMEQLHYYRLVFFGVFTDKDSSHLNRFARIGVPAEHAWKVVEMADQL